MGTRFQPNLIRRVAGLYNKIVITSYPQASTEHITHIDEFEYLRAERMRTGLKAFFVKLDPFRPD
jgi:hypothetical protein